jgi:hypothetical protein
MFQVAGKFSHYRVSGKTNLWACYIRTIKTLRLLPVSIPNTKLCIIQSTKELTNIFPQPSAWQLRPSACVQNFHQKPQPTGQTGGRFLLTLPVSILSLTLLQTKDKNPMANVGFEVLAAVVLKSFVFWDLTPCSLLRVCLTYALTLVSSSAYSSILKMEATCSSDTFGWLSMGYMALYPRKQKSSYG